MAIKIVVDSSCDISVEDAKKYGIYLEKVPLTLQIDSRVFIDDESLDVSEYVREMNSYKGVPKTAAPSPESYIKAYGGEEDVFVLTLSSKLSGSYSSACVARKVFLEDHHEKYIHVFDSKSAASALVLFAVKIQEFHDSGMSNEAIVESINKYISESHTYFILEKLDNLVKTGRMSPKAALLASVLSIKPIMGEDGSGNIRYIDKARGNKKALALLIDIMKKEGRSPENGILAISHCHNLSRALEMKDEILKTMNFAKVVICEAGGLVANYAQEFGIVLTL